MTGPAGIVLVAIMVFSGFSIDTVTRSVFDQMARSASGDHATFQYEVCEEYAPRPADEIVMPICNRTVVHTATVDELSVEMARVVRNAYLALCVAIFGIEFVFWPDSRLGLRRRVRQLAAGTRPKS